MVADYGRESYPLPCRSKRTSNTTDTVSPLTTPISIRPTVSQFLDPFNFSFSPVATSSPPPNIRKAKSRSTMKTPAYMSDLDSIYPFSRVREATLSPSDDPFISEAIHDPDEVKISYIESLFAAVSEVRLPPQRSDRPSRIYRLTPLTGTSVCATPKMFSSTAESLALDASESLVSLESNRADLCSTQATVRTGLLSVYEDQVIHTATSSSPRGPVLLMETIGSQPRTKFSGSTRPSEPTSRVSTIPAADCVSTALNARSAHCSQGTTVNAHDLEATLVAALHLANSGQKLLQTPAPRDISLSKARLPLTPISLTKLKPRTSSCFEKENVRVGIPSAHSSPTLVSVGRSTAVLRAASRPPMVTGVQIPKLQASSYQSRLPPSSSLDVTSTIESPAFPNCRQVNVMSKGWNDPDFDTIHRRKGPVKAHIHRRTSVVTIDIPSPPPIIEDGPESSATVSEGESGPRRPDPEVGDAVLEMQRQGVGPDDHVPLSKVSPVDCPQPRSTMRDWAKMVGLALTNPWRVSKADTRPAR